VVSATSNGFEIVKESIVRIVSAEKNKNSFKNRNKPRDIGKRVFGGFLRKTLKS
jgi:hypothetical protein